MTLDRYGHLFPRTDDAAETAAAEAALLGAHSRPPVGCRRERVIKATHSCPDDKGAVGRLDACCSYAQAALNLVVARYCH
jgi:hypothetical protein